MSGESRNDVNNDILSGNHSVKSKNKIDSEAPSTSQPRTRRHRRGRRSDENLFRVIVKALL